MSFCGWIIWCRSILLHQRSSFVAAVCWHFLYINFIRWYYVNIVYSLLWPKVLDNILNMQLRHNPVIWIRQPPHSPIHYVTSRRRPQSPHCESPHVVLFKSRNMKIARQKPDALVCIIFPAGGFECPVIVYVLSCWTRSGTLNLFSEALMDLKCSAAASNLWETFSLEGWIILRLSGSRCLQ